METLKLQFFGLFLLIALCSVAWSLPEPSSFTVELIKERFILNASRSLYNSSSVYLYAQCKAKTAVQLKFFVGWVELPCISAPLGVETEYKYVQEGMGDDNNYLMLPWQTITCTTEFKPFLKKKDKPGLIHIMDSDAIYFLRIQIFHMPANVTFRALIDTESSYSGNLSPIDWPLLPFYGIMCCVYALYAVLWLCLCFCYWRDLLRLQHWISAVIFLGMLEKAFFVGEYDNVNRRGYSTQGALVAAELVSCLKRTLARMLFIIVSLGFGIVRPRLGAALHRVVAVGFVYFVASAAEGLLRVVKHKSDSSYEIMVGALVLSVIDSLVCWWILFGIVRTIRDLAMKKNPVKLALYKHFRNTLIFAVLASVAFMVWSMNRHKVPECILEWKTLWIEEAFWHILFSMLLLVIMFLWRPSANNQRYAYTPQVDDADGDDDVSNHQTSNDAFETKKIRGSKTSNGHVKEKEDDDLKWVDDNIPSSADKLDMILPGLLDSDGEDKDHKYQASKME